MDSKCKKNEWGLNIIYFYGTRCKEKQKVKTGLESEPGSIGWMSGVILHPPFSFKFSLSLNLGVYFSS